MTKPTCPICGKEAQRTTCKDPRCKSEHKRRAARIRYRAQVEAAQPIPGKNLDLTCLQCGETFVGRSKQWFCSQDCRGLNALDTGHLIRLNNMHRIDPLNSVTIRGECRVQYGRCAECGNLWASNANRPKTYCSKRCTWHARERRRGSRPKSYRKHSDAVFVRDQFICWLCGTPTSQTFSLMDPLSPTLDHIQPRSLGGADDETNLATAHWICNSLRGNTDRTTWPAPAIASW